MDKNYDIIIVVNFADIIKIGIKLFKITVKKSRKVKRVRNYVLKWNFYLCFPILQKLVISGEKMLMSAKIKGCVTWLLYFLDILYVRYN